MTDFSEATFTVLSAGGPGPVEASILSTSGNEMRIAVPFDVAPETAVKIETGDMLMLGEALRVEPAEDGYVLTVNIRHTLRSISELMRLNRAILGDDAGQNGTRATGRRARTAPFSPCEK